MENGAISDHQISASSEYEKIMNHKAFQGRLHFESTPSEAGSWSAEITIADQWLQVDLGTDNSTAFQYYKEHEQVEDKVKIICYN